MLAKQYNIQFYETSAKDTINIEELFTNSTKIYIEKLGANPNKKERNLKDGVNLNHNNENVEDKKDGCC